MPVSKHCLFGVIAFTLAISAIEIIPVVGFAQSSMQQTPSVSAVTLQTQPGPGGQQMVVTPRGLVVPLPGAGVNGKSVEIYMGSQGGFWYTDKNNQNVDLTNAVQRLQARISQTGYPGSAPYGQHPYGQAPYGQTTYPTPPPQYYAQQPQTTQQPVTVNNYGTSGGSNGTNTAMVAGVSGLAAMGGAMIGSAMTSAPYGTPYYYGAGGHPYYYGANNKPVYVNNSTKTATVSGNNNSADQLNKQQQWYNTQHTQNPQQFQQWQNQHASGTNPFVNDKAKFGNEAQNDARTAGQQNRRSGGRRFR